MKIFDDMKRHIKSPWKAMNQVLSIIARNIKKSNPKLLKKMFRKQSISIQKNI